MKFIALFAAGVMAAGPALQGAPLVKRDYAAIVADFAKIENATYKLSAAVANYSAPSDLTALLDAVAVVNAAVANGTADAQSTPLLSPRDATNLVPSVVDLATAVKKSVKDSINKRCFFVFNGLGGAVEQNLQSLQNGSNTFSSAVLAIIPTFLQPTADELSAPILAALQQGVDAFANNGNGSANSTAPPCGPNGTTLSSGADRLSLGLGSVAVAALFALAI